MDSHISPFPAALPPVERQLSAGGVVVALFWILLVEDEDGEHLVMLLEQYCLT